MTTRFEGFTENGRNDGILEDSGMPDLKGFIAYLLIVYKRKHKSDAHLHNTLSVQFAVVATRWIFSMYVCILENRNITQSHLTTINSFHF